MGKAHLQGWTRREAATYLGCPEGTLSALLSRALAKLRVKLGDTAPALLAAAGVTVPAGLADAAVRTAFIFRTATLSAAAVSPAVADLTRGALRMFWLPNLLAGGMTTLACLAVGVGVGLTAADPPGGKGDEPPKSAAKPPPASKAELGYQLAQIDLAEAQIKVNNATAALEQAKQRLREEEARTQGGDQFLRVVVRPGADGFVYGLEEQSGRYAKKPDAAGTKWGTMRTDTDSPKVLEVYLAQAKADAAAPKRLWFVVLGKMSDIDPIHKAAAACVRAGFRTTTYTGPLPEKWSRGVTNDGQPTVSWTGGEMVRDKEVDLTKVLPLVGIDGAALPPASPMFFLSLPGESQRGYSLSSGAMRVGDILRRAYGVDPAWVETHTVYLRRTVDEVTSLTLIDWPGLIKGDPNVQNQVLRDGDQIRIRPKSPAADPFNPKQ